MSKTTVERRSHSRHRRAVQLQGAPEHGGAPARMVCSDLSLGGLYCTSPADFPEMTRLAVRLLLPRGGGGQAEPVDLQAIVVRRKQLRAGAGSPRYELALLFSSVREPVRRRLDRFLAEP